jgi:hypothetical protein
MGNMRNALAWMSSLAVGVAVVAFIGWWQQRPKDFFSSDQITFRGEESFPVVPHCATPQFGEIRYTASAWVTADWARHLGVDMALQVARAHERFVLGFFNYDPVGKQVARIFPLDGKSLRILSVRAAPYPHAVDFDGPQGDTLRFPPSLRKPRALKAGSPAQEIRYEARLQALSCGGTGVLDLPLDLPADPFLAYWMVPPRGRVEASFETQTARINPCADPQMVDLRDPVHFWYVWAPNRRGSCREWTTVGAQTRRVLASFTPRPALPATLSFSHLQARPVWQVGFIWGLGDNSRSATAQMPMVHELYRGWEQEGFRPDAEARRRLWERYKAAGHTVWAGMQQLQGLVEITTDTTFHASFNADSLLVEVRGRLNNSDRPLHVRFFIGSTDQAGGKPGHWDFTRQSLARDDLVFYVGHAGMGENMNLAYLHPLARGPDYQLLGLITCYSTNYYGRRYLEAREGQTTDLLRVGSGRYPYLVPLATLAYLDGQAAGKQVSWQRALARVVAPDEIVLVERVASRD